MSRDVGSGGGAGAVDGDAPRRERDGDALLSVRDLRQYYPLTSGLLNRHVGDVRAVDGVSFDLAPGETLAVVGESGSGKTTLAETVVGLERPTAGEIRYRGRDVAGRSPQERREIQREIGMVFQDPTSSLNSRMTVRQIVSEPLDVHGVRSGKRRPWVRDLLERVGLDPDAHYDRYPHELSGGQRQRVAIARALALEPSLLVLDEPVSSLDASTQANILALLADLQADDDLAFLFVSHDLSVVRHVADRVAVMYAGRFVEVRDAPALFADPGHPYTEALLADVPRIDRHEGPDVRLEGEPPDLVDPPTGCRFHPRCHLRERLDDSDADYCVTAEPRLERGVACHYRPADEQDPPD